MKLKFTKSKDGLLRADVTVKHRVSKQNLIDCIAHRSMYDREGDDINPALFDSYSKVMDVLWRELYLEGNKGSEYWTDGYSPEEYTPCIKFAERIVDIYFPELSITPKK